MAEELKKKKKTVKKSATKKTVTKKTSSKKTTTTKTTSVKTKTTKKVEPIKVEKPIEKKPDAPKIERISDVIGPKKPKKKRKIKSAFTLVELLAVIVIIGILAIVVVPSVTMYISNTRNETYKSHEKTMQEAAKSYTVECIQGTNPCTLPGRGRKTEIYLDELVEKEYLSNLQDPQNTKKNCDATKSYVIVTNNEGNYEYESCLYCGSYATNNNNCELKNNQTVSDTTEPVCGTVDNGSTSWSKGARTLTVGCEDPESGCTRDKFSKVFKESTEKGTILIRNKAGKTKECPVDVYIDNTEPTCELELVEGSYQEEAIGWISGENIQVRFKNKMDLHSGLLTYGIGTSYKNPNYNKQDSMRVNSATGTTTIFGYVKDKAGNEGMCSITVRTGIARPKFDVYYGYQLMPLKERYTVSGMSVTDSGVVTTSSTTPKITFTGMSKYANVKRAVIVTQDTSLENGASYKLNYGSHAASALVNGNRIEFDIIKGTYDTYTFTLGTTNNKTIKIKKIELEVENAIYATNKEISVNLIPKTTEVIKTTEFSFDNGEHYGSTYYKDFNTASGAYSANVKTKNDIGMESDPKPISINQMDVVGPVINSVTPNTTNYTNQDVVLTGKAINANSGIIEYAFSTNANLPYYSSEWKQITITKSEITKSTNVPSNTTMYFYVKDEAGNVSKKSQTIGNIDKEPPTCTNSGDNSSWTRNSVTIKWGCSDTGGSGCETTEASRTFTTTTHTAVISSYVVKDRAGNQTTCPQRTANVYVDTTAPTCGVASGASTTWVNTNRTIKQDCNDANSGCEKSSYETTYSTTTQTASVVIKDKVGNQTTCTYNVYVDKTAPSCGTATGASTTWTASNRTIKQACSDAQAGCVQSSYDTTYSTTTQTSSVVIKDKAGNETTCNYNVYVDKTAPSCGTATGASTTWTNANRTIKQACNDSQSGCAQSSYDTTYSTTTQTSSVVIKDKVGNQTTCNYNVYVDKTPPTCGNTTGSSTTWTNSNKTVKQSCNDANSGCVQSTYETTYSTTTQTASITIKDNAGNTSTCTFNVYIDTTPPSCGTATGATTAWTAGNRTIKQACSDGQSGCAQSSYDTTYTSTTKTSSVVIKDKVGNQTTCTYNVYVDKTAPTCGAATNSSTTWTNANRTIKQACSDGHSGCVQASYDTTYSSTTQTSSVVIKDQVGNQTTCSYNVYVDKTAPSCSISRSNTGTTSGVTLSVSCSDGNSGCASGNPTGGTGLKTGNYSYTVKDVAGNQATCSASVTQQVQQRTKSCSTGKRCSSASCETWKSCANSACGVAQYKSCANSACGVASYKRCSAAGCETYNSCANSACGVAQYKSCSTSACGVASYNRCSAAGCQTYKYCSNSACGVASYKSCATSACGVASYKTCRTSACGVASYNRCSAAGCQTYNSCSTSACGVASYKTCRNSACGSTTSTYSGRSPSCSSGCHMGGPGSLGSGMYRWNCTCPKTCATSACGVASYKTCRTSACGCQTYNAGSACGVAQYNSCSTSACGVASYKTCANSACGVASYSSCRTSGCGCQTYNASSACGVAAYNTCRTSACGVESYNTCRTSGCGCQTYKRGSSCGVESYNTCRTSGCGVESYNTCRTSGCGCETYSRDTSKCGCETWGSFGSWTNVNSCSAGESSNHSTTTECRTLYS